MKMLAPNPKKRLTIQDVLAHPWMSDREKVHRTHLPETVESLKVFNSKRKLKAAVQSIAGGITADSMFGTDTDISKLYIYLAFYYGKETAKFFFGIIELFILGK